MTVMPLNKPAPPAPTTCTGGLLLVVGSFPNWPVALLPQAQTVPSNFSAKLCDPPAAMAVMPLNKPAPPAPTTCTGVLLLVVVLFPNWPVALLPQAHTVPSNLSAKLCWPPPARPLTTARLLTFPGVVL